MIPMTMRGLELLLGRLRKLKKVFVYEFNVEGFRRYIELCGVSYVVGSMEFDENGNVVGRYFEID